MNSGTRVNISDLIDNRPVGAFQTRLFVLCSLCLIFAGFNVQAMGYVAPVLSPELGIDRAQMGTILGAGNFGVLLGSLLFTMIGDRFGRRTALLISTLTFAGLTIAAGRAESLQEMLWLRFFGGLGMGSIVPNATALIGEYSPTRHRITLIMCITVSFTAGAAVGGFVSAALIPALGWRSVFYFGGAVPLLLAMAMYLYLPESLQFLVLRGKRRQQIRRWLNHLDPASNTASDVEYVVREESRAGVPLRHLFGEGRARVTLLLWIVNFLNLLNLFFLAGWLPTVLSEAGHSTQTAVLVGTILQVGGTVGTFGLAWLISKSDFIPILVGTFTVATVSIALIGTQSVLVAVPVLTAVVFISGWCVVGGQPALNAMAATFYPTYMRSTGVGWCLGIGRIGAIVGPVVGGQLMALQWSSEQIFFLAASAALISTVLMFTLRWVFQPEDSVGTAPRAPAH
jgi:AAHS family 4-hydroxybenzoate transporter-like MFS transporter